MEMFSKVLRFIIFDSRRSAVGSHSANRIG